MTTQQATPTSQQVKNSTLAIVSLVAGLAGWTILPVLGSIVADITGRVAKNEIRESMGLLGGENMATAGLVLAVACGARHSSPTKQRRWHDELIVFHPLVLCQCWTTRFVVATLVASPAWSAVEIATTTHIPTTDRALA